MGARIHPDSRPMKSVDVSYVNTNSQTADVMPSTALNIVRETRDSIAPAEA